MRRIARILLVALVLAALSYDGTRAQGASLEIKGAGGSVSTSSAPSLLSVARAVAGFGGLRWLPWAQQESQPWLPNAPALGNFWRSPSYQLELDSSLVSDGQFVWGPNVGDFNIGAFLENLGSPLAAYAPDIELWASYSSVNPEVLIAILELRYGWVSGFSDLITEDEMRSTIEDTAMGLASTFYEHMYTWGALRPAFSPAPAIGPSVLLQDGSVASLDPSLSSATVALITAMADDISPVGYESKFAGVTRDFSTIFGAMGLAAHHPINTPLQQPMER